MLQYIIISAVAGLSVLLIAIWCFLAGVYVTQRSYGELDAIIEEKYRNRYSEKLVSMRRAAIETSKRPSKTKQPGRKVHTKKRYRRLKFY